MSINKSVNILGAVSLNQRFFNKFSVHRVFDLTAFCEKRDRTVPNQNVIIETHL